MIETFAVAIILALFAVFLIFTFFSYVAMFLNLIILVALYFLITTDLKSRDNQKYYIAALLLTAIFFISSSTGIVNHFLALTERMMLSAVTLSVIAVYVFAHLTAFIYGYYHHLKGKRRK